jgi:hypothetical protein
MLKNRTSHQRNKKKIADVSFCDILFFAPEINTSLALLSHIKATENSVFSKKFDTNLA